MLDLALAGSLEDWTVDLDRLPAVADFVAQVTRESYPRLDVPMHARWRHFVFNGRDLWQDVSSRSKARDTKARARAAFDLAITSVLLDAGRARVGVFATRRRALSPVARRGSRLRVCAGSKVAGFQQTYEIRCVRTQVRFSASTRER
jgi:hypothetical protein